MHSSTESARHGQHAPRLQALAHLHPHALLVGKLPADSAAMTSRTPFARLQHVHDELASRHQHQLGRFDSLTSYRRPGLDVKQQAADSVADQQIVRMPGDIAAFNVHQAELI